MKYVNNREKGRTESCSAGGPSYKRWLRTVSREDEGHSQICTGGGPLIYPFASMRWTVSKEGDPFFGLGVLEPV